jgi:hypothetical protein
MQNATPQEIGEYLAQVSSIIRHGDFKKLLVRHDSRFDRDYGFIAAVQARQADSLCRSLRWADVDNVPARGDGLLNAQHLNAIADYVQKAAYLFAPALKKKAFAFTVPRSTSFVLQAMKVVGAKGKSDIQYDIASFISEHWLSGVAYLTDIIYSVRAYIVSAFVLRHDTHNMFYEQLLQRALNKGADYWLESAYCNDLLVHDFDVCNESGDRVLAIGYQPEYLSSSVAVKGSAIDIDYLESRGLDIIRPS